MSALRQIKFRDSTRQRWEPLRALLAPPHFFLRAIPSYSSCPGRKGSSVPQVLACRTSNPRLASCSLPNIGLVLAVRRAASDVTSVEVPAYAVECH